MEYKDSKPYPEIRVENKNKEYAKILLEDYAGINSETTAVFQYSYQSISNYEIEELSEILEQISIVEMKHIELLGKTITLLGELPKLSFNYNNYLTYWSGSFIDYTTNIKEFLIMNIQAEKNAIENYKKHACIINDKYIKELLYRIIDDEKKHIECFNILLEKYSSLN